MKRKNFITGTTVLGLSFSTSPLNTTGNQENMQKEGSRKTKPDADFELEEITIARLQELMASGKQTAQSLTSLYLKRIEDIDKNSIALKAVLTLNQNAINEAAKLDEERKAAKLRGPLHGIPILIKDNIDTSKMPTTAGSLALEGFHPAKDAFIVDLLKKAGAVILGKTNLSEWANIRSEHSSSGWSSLGGQTKNPYILDRNPVGSSSGSAVAVAANLCAVAIGTETDGSIVAPSSGNGVVGLKPTVGLISRSGIIPISHTQDSAGPIARNVTDAATLLGTLTTQDIADDAMNSKARQALTNYLPFLKPEALKSKRIGVEKNWKSINTDLNRIYQGALEKLKQEGAVIVEIELLKEIDKAGEAEFEVLKQELKDGLNRYLAQAGAPVKSLAELVQFNIQNEARVMPFFKQEILESAEKTEGMQSKAYLEALAKCKLAVKAIDEAFSSNKLDAISGITLGPVGATDLIYGDRYGDAGFASPAAIAGYPHITVPAGFTYHLPVGLSFFGKAWSEGELLGIAYAYEQATRHRRKPEYLETLS